MYYKYKKYKKKYIDMKNQIGGNCIISPTDDNDQPIKYNDYKLKLSLNNNNNYELKCFSTIKLANHIFLNCYTPPESNFNTQLFNINKLESIKQTDYNTKFPISPILKYDIASLESIREKEDYTKYNMMDINQIWYIITTNNNYIIALNKKNYEAEGVEKDAKTKNTFLYTTDERVYIEKCLLIFKHYNFLIYSFDTIPSFEEFKNGYNLTIYNKKKYIYKNILTYINIFTQNDIPIYTGTDSNIEYMKIKEKYKETKSIFTSSTKMIKQYYDILPHIINIITKIQQIILTFGKNNILDNFERTYIFIKHNFETTNKDIKKKLYDNEMDLSEKTDDIERKKIDFTNLIKPLLTRIKYYPITISKKHSDLISTLEIYIKSIINNNNIYRLSWQKKNLDIASAKVSNDINIIIKLINDETANTLLISYTNIIEDIYFKRIFEKYNRLKIILIDLLIIHQYILKQNFSNLINDFKLSINNTCNILIEHIELILNDKINILNHIPGYIESENSKKLNTQTKNLINNDLLNIENKYNYIVKYLTIFDDIILINNIIIADDNIISEYINTDIENIKTIFNEYNTLFESIDVENIYTKIKNIYNNIKFKYDELFTNIPTSIENIIHDNVEITIKNFKEEIKIIQSSFNTFNLYLINFKKLFYNMYICMKTKIILTELDNDSLTNILTNNTTNLLDIYEHINNLNIYIDNFNDLTYINSIKDRIE